MEPQIRVPHSNGLHPFESYRVDERTPGDGWFGPSSTMARALFHAWLLQPKASRDVLRTVSLVRVVLERQLLAAEQDIAVFAQP